MRYLKPLLVACATVAMAPAAFATTLTNGNVSMGLFDDGSLGSGGLGFAFLGEDAITPGCLCEGWGVAANGDGAHYTYGAVGVAGFASAAISDVTASSAKSTVATTNGLSVVHTYSSVPGDTLFRIDIVIRNDSGADVTDVRYARTLDWDVPPDHFGDDFTTVFGGPGGAPDGALFHTSTNPFDVPNPMVTRSQNADTNVVDAAGDLGSYFIFAFGDLAMGEEVTFTTYIGAARTTGLLLSAFAGVGVEAYSYTFDDSTPHTFGYGFLGLGLPPIDEVPEPAMLGLFGLGLVGLGAARRRRKA